MHKEIDTGLSEPLLFRRPAPPPQRFSNSYEGLKQSLHNMVDWRLMRKILNLSAQRIFSLDGSMEFWVISYLIGQFKDDQGESTDYQAAANLISTTTNFKMCFILFPLMSYFTLGGPLLGKKRVPSDEEIKTRRLSHEDIFKAAEAANAAKLQYPRLARNTLLVGAPFTAVVTSSVFFSNQLWKLLGVNANVIDLIQQFQIPLSIISPLIGVRFICDAILFMENKSFIVMSTSMSCWLLFGVFTSYFLGMGGIGAVKFPAMKIGGVFLGFFGQIVISCLIVMGVIKKSADFKDFHFLKDFFKWTREDGKQVREIVPVALANWFAIVAELTAQLAINVMAANCGSPQAAAQNFVQQIVFFFLLWTYALAQVGQQLVGIELGAGNKTSAGRNAKYTLGLSLLPAPIYLLFALKPRFLTNLTTSVDASVLQYTDSLIPYACITSTLYTFQYVMLEALRPTKKFYRALFLAISGLWSGVLAAHFLSKEQDILGIARGGLLGGGLAVTGVAYYFSKNFLMPPLEQSEVQEQEEYKLPKARVRDPHDSVSSNRYGCFSCFSRLYKRFFQTQDTDLTESTFDLQ